MTTLRSIALISAEGFFVYTTPKAVAVRGPVVDRVALRL